MTGPFTCRVIGETSELQSIAPQWWALWRSSPDATPFQSPAWLLSWWTTFAPGKACVFVVQLNGRLVGLAPLYLEQGQQRRRVRPMGFPLTDYYDFLIAPNLEQPVLAVLTSHLADASFWDVLELTELPPDAHALRMNAPAGCDVSDGCASACPVLSLPDTFDESARIFPARKHRSIRCARHRVERRGPMQIIAADTDSALDSFDMLAALHQRRWNSRDEPGVLTDPHVQQFHRDALPALMQAGLLRFYILKINGHTAAAYYGLQHRDQSYAYLTGFEPAYAYESPGVILLDHAIVEAAREGIRKVHFLRGREPYKYGWGVRDYWNKQRIFKRKT